MNSNYVYLFGTIILILAIILRFTNNGLFSLYGVNTPNAANYVSIGVDILFGILFVYLALQSKVSALAIELVQNAGGKKHR
jgi:hypothetical protein